MESLGSMLSHSEFESRFVLELLIVHRDLGREQRANSFWSAPPRGSIDGLNVEPSEPFLFEKLLIWLILCYSDAEYSSKPLTFDMFLAFSVDLSCKFIIKGDVCGYDLNYCMLYLYFWFESRYYYDTFGLLKLVGRLFCLWCVGLLLPLLLPLLLFVLFEFTFILV